MDFSRSSMAKCERSSLCNLLAILVLLITIFSAGCFRYSFSGTSIPEGVNSIFLPFFADQSSSGIGDLSDRLNQILINRFINQTKLRLANSRSDGDAIIEGAIISYNNQPFSVTGNDQANQNEVIIRVRATYQYSGKDQPEWSKTFSGTSTYDPNDNPIDGETTAAEEALTQIVNNMFNDAVSGW